MAAVEKFRLSISKNSSKWLDSLFSRSQPLGNSDSENVDVPYYSIFY